ncbi:MAG: carbamoyl-phosphate synthase large subunit [Clostridiales bacterium]|jgi:carbamoyl-phosphate synthase large subunit|nr:carbamoyl-phosphate synthase large subunit [Clostridiales bacterium]
MPFDASIKKVLVIGSGPIVIGQAAEFDYAGTQACRALREDDVEIVLINSNPATIMTDSAMADKIYIEPLTVKTVERIIDKEKPDSILSGLGGQTGLNLCMRLAREGFLKKRGVRLLGASPETIDKAEDRKLFKETMESIGQPCVPSVVATDIAGAEAFAGRIGYPVIIRPAFTLGGSGGGIVATPEELRETTRNGLSLSPIKQVLVEKCVAGWKEIEFEVMRDGAGNVITVCSMENMDPVGVHTGDSIVIAPAVTLSDKEYQMLRSAALDIITAIGVTGGCNVQFALNPDSFEYAVIEVNPRVSRSSALASKAAGYPIAKVAAKIAIGYTLDEIKNAVTGRTYAAFEPTLDYVAVKFPKWPFDKFVYAKRDLGTQMKATGEVMAIADSFEMAMMKAVRSAEVGRDTFNLPRLAALSDGGIRDLLTRTTDERSFVLFEALKRGIPVDEIFGMTKVDRWFLHKLLNLAEYEKSIAGRAICAEEYVRGKRLGYTDAALTRLSGAELPARAEPVYKMVDTCGGEFAAVSPYFYSTFDTPEMGAENEAPDFIGKSGRGTVIVLGSGPIRIGQGIEFDYASVHCVWALKEMGYDVAIINNNPETVSTDFDTSDRLYFEPLTPEDVMNIIRMEKPLGVVVAFGGQTAIKLTKTLADNNVRIIGASADCIDMAEDRERFDALLERAGIKRPKGFTVMTTDEALSAANELSYPVLMRPSYVLGGQNMIIAFTDGDIREYMEIIFRQKQDNPVLIDKYLSGTEVEVDAIFDGEDLLIPGIMEHVERTGIHSGDSIAVYPAPHIDDPLAEGILETTRKLCEGLGAVGIINIQYIIYHGEIYVIEVNPRASRTVPYLSKVVSVPMVDLATRVSLGGKLRDLGYGVGVYKVPPYVAVKVPVFSFEKLIDVDTQLGPEMKSTGEVLGVGKNLEEALYKGFIAAGYKMRRKGGLFVTVRDGDKDEIVDIIKKYAGLGFNLFATKGTADVLEKAGMSVTRIGKIYEGGGLMNTIELLESGKANYLISTSTKGRDPALDSVKMRRKASQLGIPCLTSVDTANAIADCLISRYSETNIEYVDINALRKEPTRLKYFKMQDCGNDYICIDCADLELTWPESLSVFLSDRHFGVGSDGIVLILPSDAADAGMRMFNLDGSESAMSGNGVRCVAKYLFDSGLAPRRELTIETLDGVKSVRLTTKNGKAFKMTVDMGRARLTPSDIPVCLSGQSVISRRVEVAGAEREITCVSMGNPHCVVFYDNVDTLDLTELGPMFEMDPLFPERVNTEFVKVIDERTIRMRVWERGAGETLACGTGACASVVAAARNGLCEKGADVRVIVGGGELVVRYTDESVYLTGSAKKVYEGIVEI